MKRSFFSRNDHGFTLIELMIVVAIIGILAAVAVPSFIKYIKKAKTAEALGNLEKMYNAARVYYLEDHGQNNVSVTRRMFPTTVGPTPTVSCCNFGDERCEPTASWWTDRTWRSLNFSMDDPHYFRYEFRSSGSGTAAQFTALAYADLDCDGEFSTFSMGGVSSYAGSGAGSAAMSGTASVFRQKPLE